MRGLLRSLSLKRLYYRVVRQEGSPESIARGVALGLFVGFFVPIGGQVVIVLLLAFLLRANKILSVLFTFPTNPWTVPFIYPVQCYFGSILMGSPLRFYEIKGQFKQFFKNPTWNGLLDLGDDIVWPFFVAGFVMAVVSAVIGYYASLGMVQKYRKRREARLRRRLSMISARDRTTTIQLPPDAR